MFHTEQIMSLRTFPRISTTFTTLALHWTNSKIPISSQVTRCELQLALEFDSSHRNFHLAKSLQRHASLCVKHVEIWLTFCIIIFLLLRKLKCERAKSMGWKWKFLKYLTISSCGVVYFFQFSVNDFCKVQVENNNSFWLGRLFCELITRIENT